ncbi:GNAT family N-acetyltransferase [Methylobacter sp.]|uniref:GNAT family N-acetyltransferase n=1 Tax=Methylobacter sp. TaxID=2051955 RepID=UPI001219BE3C|nr:GNAT family N-acetyltransferase [Methylobacter sp.]TAK65181.1 MAG: GNAT family N-acetyltransferase [Methylobacter sp.]
MDINISSSEALSEAVIKKLNQTKTGFFSTFLWYRNFVDTVIKKDSGNYGFLIAESNGKEHVVFPFMLTILKNGCRQLRSLTNYYSPLYQLVYDKSVDFDGVTLSVFFDELKRGTLHWDIMELQPLDQEGASFLSLQLQKAKIFHVSFFCFGNWYLEINNRSFDEYFAGLSSKVRNTVNRKTKQFEKLQGAEVVIVTEKKDLDAAISAYERVYASSWKQDEPYPDFIPGLIKIAEEIGSLRLGIAYLNNVAIAVQLWIVADNTAYIYKLAYDENYKQYGAGTMLTTKLMKHVIDYDKVEVVDYLCGDDPYKKDWMSHRRERWGILAFNTSSLRGVWEMAKEMSKVFLKKVAFFKKISLFFDNIF